jgi:hypothetical protein
MRNVTTVCNQILILLPSGEDFAALPASVADNVEVLGAELRILIRTDTYTPTEAQSTLWARLGAILYRYMPPVAAYPWAQQISTVVNS